jgi:hypothetical protein
LDAYVENPFTYGLTFPEHGIVVSVTSNTSYADTFGVGVKIAQAFAEQGRNPARK